MAGKGTLAKEIRTGLIEEPSLHLRLVNSAPDIDPLDQLYFRKSIRQHVREFACVIGIVSLIIAGFRVYKHADFKWGIGLLILAIFVVFLGYEKPSFLQPLWRAWMNIAEKIALVVSMVILSIAWTFVLVPIALIVRFFKTRVMDLSFRAPVESYWEVRDKKNDDFQLLKRQY